MKKIKPIKPKLGRRITNAIKCLKGEPWPVPLTYELPKVERYNIKSFGCYHEVGPSFDEWAPVDMDRIIRENVAGQLVECLLTAGAIEITTSPTPDRFGRKRYWAKIRVVMPEKKEG